MSEQAPHGDFETIASQLNDADKIEIALAVNRDILAAYDSGSITNEQQDQGVQAIEELMGECSYPSYCKFYGADATFCDRACDIPIWDQI